MSDPSPRSLDQVESELAATRLRLANTVDDLAEAVSPQELARRQAEKAKAFVVEPDGTIRTERVAKIVGAVVALLALRSVVRHRSR